MRATKPLLAVLGLSLLTSATPARAQLLDSLKGMSGMAHGSGQGGSQSGGGVMGGGMMGGLAMPSVGQAGAGNTAGVLGFCMKNNYLGGTDASSVKSGLMSRLGGQGSRAPGYQSGNQGLLQTGGGHSYDLKGGGLKAQITSKVCDQILKHGKSLL